MSKIDEETAVTIAAVIALRDSPHCSEEDLRKMEEDLIARTKTYRFVIGILCSAIYAMGFFFCGFMALANGDGISICIAAILFWVGVYCICRKPVRKSIQIIHDRWRKE